MTEDRLLYIIAIIFLLIAVIAFFFLIYPANGFRIVTVGDISCNHESLTTMNNIVNYTKLHKTDAFVFLGDAQYGGSYDQCVEGFFKEEAKYTTVLGVIGNHDSKKLWNNLTKAVPTISKSLVWNKTIDDVLLIGMNTNEPWNNTSPQYKQVVNVLDTTVAEYKLVFMHKHVIDNCRPDKDRFMCGFYQLYNPVFQQYKVDCVISGHLHTVAILNSGGMCYAIYGMGGATPYAIRHGFFGTDIKYKAIQEHGFVVIDKVPTGLVHAFHTNNGDLIRKHFAEK